MKRLLQTLGFGVGTVLPRLAALALIPLLTSNLSQEEFGRFSYAETIASLLITCLALGLPASVVRIHSRKDDGAVSRLSTLLVLIPLGLLGLAGLSLFAGYWVQPIIDGWLGAEFSVLLGIAIVGAVVQQLMATVQALNQAERRAGLYALVATAQSVGLIALMYYLVGELDLGDQGVLLARLGGLSAAFIAGVYIYFKMLRRAAPATDFIKEIMVFAVPLVPHQLVAFALNAGDRFVIERWLGFDEVGLYSLAYSFGTMLSVVTTVVMLLWAPRFYASADSNAERVGRVSLWWMALVAFASMVGMVAGPPFVILLSDAKFHSAAPLVPLIMCGYFFHAAFSIFSLQVLHEGSTGALAGITVFAAVLNIVLNIATVGVFGIAGAAIATLLAFLLEAVAVYFIGQKLFHIPHEWGKYLVAAIGVTAVAVLSWLTGVVASTIAAIVVLAVLWKIALGDAWSNRRAILSGD